MCDKFFINDVLVCELKLSDKVISLYIPDEAHGGYFEYGDSTLSQDYDSIDVDGLFYKMSTDLSAIISDKVSDDLILKNLSTFINKYGLTV